MPELPEVEIVCQGLRQSILGQKISNVSLRRQNLRLPFPDNFCQILTGRIIKQISRRAKYIELILDDSLILIIHLGMTGQLVVHKQATNNTAKHDHVLFDLEHGQQMIFNDTRRFGLMTICHQSELSNHKLYANLGPEPLGPSFTPEYLYQKLKASAMPIKTALMNNQIVVGVGNIYACEALFKANISPLMLSKNLLKADFIRLVPIIQNILKEAIIAGGSSFSNYVNSQGKSGYFQHSFQVYGRNNQPCYICSAPIMRAKQAGRSSFYCPACQKIPS